MNKQAGILLLNLECLRWITAENPWGQTATNSKQDCSAIVETLFTSPCDQAASPFFIPLQQPLTPQAQGMGAHWNSKQHHAHK